MAFVLFEDHGHFDLLPFCYTRPVYALRAGIFTNQERWQRSLDGPVLSLAYDYLDAAFTSLRDPNPQTWINGRMIPDPAILHLIHSLEPDSYILDQQDQVIAGRFAMSQLGAHTNGIIDKSLLEESGLTAITVSDSFRSYRYPEDLYTMNGQLLAFDFELLCKTESPVGFNDPYTRVYGADNLFVEAGVSIKAAVINAEDGPIYIGSGATIQEGALIRGAHCIGQGARISMGSKLRGESTIGPKAKAGGEIANSILMGFCNKGHEGYLGNSVIGYWCNLGADSNTSNLKNNYTEVKLWHYPSGSFRKTGKTFCGLMMGDHSKCGINTMFNTGTVVGVSANIFGAGYPRNFIPSFAWGGRQGYKTYRLNKAIETARIVMPRKGKEFGEQESEIFQHIYEETASHRFWETQRKTVV